jgi:endoglucanase
VVIGVPARYIHSHVGLFDRRDFEAACRLLPELVTELDAERASGFTRFD